MIKVIKRDGSIVDFNKEKIIIAITKANNSLTNEEDKIDDNTIYNIATYIETNIEDDKIAVESIQDMVESELIKLNKYKLAKEYIIYRYNRALIRKANTTDESILSLVKRENKDVMEENSNKDAILASTQRDLIAGEVSKDLTRRILLPENISKAHDEGIIHFHDADYFLQPIFNCCLINIKDMLDNGTVMNGKMIESPKSFRVACTVMTQIVAAVASSQYGGQSVNIGHLGKYLKVSEDKFKKQAIDILGEDTDKSIIDNYVSNRLTEELKAGIQTIQYQINTLFTSNGQSPFVTLFMYLDDNDPYIEYNALIFEEIFNQRIKGIKNSRGVYVTPTFPKLIYVLDENNNLTGGRYDYLTKLAAKCISKRMNPDIISAKKMRANYEGNVFSCMGCVDGSSMIRYKIKDVEYIEPFEKAWERIETTLELTVILQPNLRDFYIDLPEYVSIWDTNLGDFTRVYRIIKNYQVDWYEVFFSNGKSLKVTSDHPFEVIDKGVVLTKDLEINDSMLCEYDGTCNVVNIEHYPNHYDYSYDVTTESEHFTVNGIYSHNCRSFLSPWKDENGAYKFEGRFNMGVVSINLPQIGIIAQGDENIFWKLFDERLELCKEALLCRYNSLKGTLSDVSPIHWQHGAIARLKQGEKIDKYLEDGYSTLSLGYIGLYELTKLMKNVPQTDPVGKEFALRVMKHLKEVCKKWKDETGLGFALYGTPAESLCYRFARIDKAKYGDIKDITDKGYYTNSYHIDVREEIDAFTKFKIESEFQDLSLGGAISYVEIPNMKNNMEALYDLLKFVYDNIEYAEFNTRFDICMNCGFEGEIRVNDNLDWECPNCHTTDHNLLEITRRTNLINPLFIERFIGKHI
jgi:anaerobic ribonucleoside-triphosphate reductase